ncbi:MAG: ATP-dependent zinc metalloprotease FtsH [Firmicutes bacterium]|nr:ATP-dependent zinc metalloprotease FtsH [Bacillota bacterium]
MNNNKRAVFVVALIVVAVILLVIIIPSTRAKVDVISYSEVIEKLDPAYTPTAEDKNGDIINDRIIGIYFTSSYEINVLYAKDIANLDEFKKGNKPSAKSMVTYRDNLMRTVENLYEGDLENLPFIRLNDPNANSFLSYLFPVLTLVILLVLGVVIFMSIRGGKGGNTAMSFGKSKARVASQIKIRFNDVAGAEEEKEELKEIVEFLKTPKKFRQVGARIPKGVLLVGSPGTGKTLFAKAVAGEANVPFFSISGSDFVEMFVGVGASRVRDLFAQAKRNQPCIVFIDEIDAVGRKRGAGLGGGNDEREQTLNQLLVQMDGFDENESIVIMAATNRADVLDPALLRPGRFDRQIYVNMPDVAGREGIFRVHSKNKPLSADIDFKNLARITTGFSGADIENLLNEAAILAARDDRQIILMKDITEGINKVIAGPQKRSRVITERDRRLTAYHEAGHAIVARCLKYCDDVQEVSIIPRGMAGGYTLSRPKTDDNYMTKNRLNDEIAMMLGGRAAEEIIIQDISTGASSDLKRSTGIARQMVVEWGMSDELPNIFFGGEQEVFIGRDYQTQALYSESVASVIDREMRKIIDLNYGRAIRILKEKVEIMHSLVKLLFAHETIYGDELDLILEGKSVSEVTEYIGEKKREQERIAEERRKAIELAEQALREAKAQAELQATLKNMQVAVKQESQDEETKN